MARNFADLVDDIRQLPADARRELHSLIERSLIDERRREILDSYEESIKELRAGKLRFSSDISSLRKDLEDST